MTAAKKKKDERQLLQVSYRFSPKTVRKIRRAHGAAQAKVDERLTVEQFVEGLILKGLR